MRTQSQLCSLHKTLRLRYLEVVLWLDNPVSLDNPSYSSNTLCRAMVCNNNSEAMLEDLPNSSSSSKTTHLVLCLNNISSSNGANPQHNTLASQPLAAMAASNKKVFNNLRISRASCSEQTSNINQENDKQSHYNHQKYDLNHSIKQIHADKTT